MRLTRPALLLALPLVVAVLVLTGCGTATTGTVASSTPSASVSSTPTGSPDTRPGRDGGSSAATSPTVPALLDFTARTVDGADFAGAELAGRPVVLWFWAPWCPTCRGQVDEVAAAASAHGEDVAFVGVGGLDEEAAIADFAADVPGEVVEISDPDGEVWRRFGITEQSTYVVLDADGEVVSSGYLDGAALLDVTGRLAGA